MNISTIFYVCLFIPFVILFAIFGSIFMTAGYKKDLGRSLISLGASILAVLVSFCMSKLLAWGLSFAVNNLLVKILPSDNPMMAGLLGGTVQGVIKIVLALFFFGIFFAVSFGIFKTILSNRVPLDKLNLNTKGSKWGGLGVRFVDALLVVLMLSLPLYGTLATVVPPASSIMQMMAPEQFEQQDAITPTASVRRDTLNVAFMDTSAEDMADELEDELENYMSDGDIFTPEKQPQSSDSLVSNYISIMKTVEDHPVLIPYKYGPADWVYSGLSSFSMNGKAVDISRAAEVIDGLTERLVAFVELTDTNNEEQIRAAAEDIVSYTRDNVIEERWFYNLCMAIVGEFDKMVAEHSNEIGGEGMETISQLRPLFDMSYEEFKSNGVAMLDFLEYCLSGDVVNLFYKSNKTFMPSDIAVIFDEFLTRLGALINHSEQAVAVKQFIYIANISTNFQIQNTDLYFEKNWGNGMLTEADAQKRDAATFFALISGVNKYDLLQLFAINPLFGGETAALILNEERMREEISYSMYDYADKNTVRTLLENDSTLMDSFKATLVSYEQLSVLESHYYSHRNSFEAYVVQTVGDKLGVNVDSFYDDAVNFSLPYGYKIETPKNFQA